MGGGGVEGGGLDWVHAKTTAIGPPDVATFQGENGAPKWSHPPGTAPPRWVQFRPS